VQVVIADLAERLVDRGPARRAVAEEPLQRLAQDDQPRALGDQRHRAAERDLETRPQLGAVAPGAIDVQAVLAASVHDGPKAAAPLDAGVLACNPPRWIPHADRACLRGSERERRAGIPGQRVHGVGAPFAETDDLVVDRPFHGAAGRRRAGLHHRVGQRGIVLP
jgi:hypothetical protein